MLARYNFWVRPRPRLRVKGPLQCSSFITTSATAAAAKSSRSPIRECRQRPADGQFEFQQLSERRQHRYIGGLAKQSPVRLQIPHGGTWYVTVDMIGLGGSVRSSARVLPGPLPELRMAPLSSVPSLIQDHLPPSVEPIVARDYDVFISHASEDKDAVVRPLAHALSDGGLTVWYDEFELRIGDSLRRKIDTGLAKSRFGIVVLSRSFFGKGWTNYELDGLVTRAVSGEQVLLPIWHEITKQELIA
jgi:hypothetical protein